jgi:DNA-binding GntR family transcriptional regulator
MRHGAVRPSRRLLDDFGVSRYAARRAYAQLVTAGLISLVSENGKSPTVTILDVAEEAE